MQQNSYIPTGLKLGATTGKFGDYLQNPNTSKDRLQAVAKNMGMLRREADMSQKEVCEVIGCAPQTYSGYEKGKHEPTIETLVRLAHLYGVTMDYLVGTNEHIPLKAAEEDVENIAKNRNLRDLFIQVEFLNEQVIELKKQLK